MHTQEHEEQRFAKISRRTAIKGLLGLPLALLTASCVPFNTATDTRSGFPTPSAPYPTPPPFPGHRIYTFSGHTKWVSAVAWSPNGKRIASGSSDTTVKIWDSPSGGNIFTYNGNGGPVNALAWSSDGKRIASGSVDQ